MILTNVSSQYNGANFFSKWPFGIRDVVVVATTNYHSTESGLMYFVGSNTADALGIIMYTTQNFPHK